MVFIIFIGTTTLLLISWLVALHWKNVYKADADHFAQSEIKKNVEIRRLKAAITKLQLQIADEKVIR